MSATMLVAALLAQSAPLIVVPGYEGRTGSEIAYAEVGYDELSAGHNAAAIHRIRANRALDMDDPAALINLGTASARMGDMAKAEGYYRAAMASRSRYELELADGRWMDSRQAARSALSRLSQGQMLAAR